MIPHARIRRLGRLLPASVVLLASLLTAGQLTRAQEEQPGLIQIHAPDLQSMGITGKGVTIAIVDTGILGSHPEFAGRVAPGFSVFNSTADTLDQNGHGTHVAGIAAAAKDGMGTVGVAPEATLLPIQVLDRQGNGNDPDIARGIDFAASHGAFAMNLSIGGPPPTDMVLENAMRGAVNAGMVIAIAAGNSSAADPEFPAQFAKESWANGQIIAVGAVDGNNQLASFSNRAGNTKDFFLVAPGVNVTSTFSQFNPRTRQFEGAFQTLSGTSMSTPYVTGAAALVKSGWQFLSAQQVASILLTSARDLGAPGVDEVFGHGLLDLKAALEPIGKLQMPTSSGARVALSGTSMGGSTATSAALRAAGRAGQLRVAGFDSFGRDFQVDLGRAVRPAENAANPLGPMLAAVENTLAQAEPARVGRGFMVRRRSDATRLAMGDRAALRGSSGSAFAASIETRSGGEFMVGQSGMGGESFGLAAELARQGDAQWTAGLANPYFSLLSDHVHAGMRMPLAGGLHLNAGVLLSDPRQLPFEVRREGQRQRMGLVEVSGGGGPLVWSLGMARLQESDAVLGGTQSGSLRFRGTTGTTIMTAGVAFSPSARLKLGAQYSTGRTGPSKNGVDSLLTDFTTSRSDAYAMFVSLSEPFGKGAGDHLSLTISQPLRALSGSMRMAVPLRADANGAPVMGFRSIGLRPGASETRADLLYMRPINDGAQWFFGLSARRHPNHDALSPMDWILGAGFRMVF